MTSARNTPIPVFDGGDRTIIIRPPPPDMADDAPDQDLMQIVASDDGGVELHAPAVHSRQDDGDSFDRNLAEDMSETDRARLADDVLSGVDDDDKARAKFLDTLVKGIDLLGFEIREDGGSSQDGSISKVQDTLLAETVITAQSRAIAELLPAQGPVKAALREGDTRGSDELAQAFERDMNAYLTHGAPEYYPDMHRGLFGFFFGGNLTKKVYQHPLRRRPVSECIDIGDLIVSPEAVDLDTALRVTHRNEMSRVLVERMKWRGGWLDVDLGTPSTIRDRVSLKEAVLQGVNVQSARPNDTPFTLYETLTDVDLGEYALPRARGAPDGLPLPLRVTVERDSRQLLAVHRAWNPEDKEFLRQTRMVHYGMIPAFGFLSFGYVHMLGNHAKALSAIWRILIDAGMYANAPGGFKGGRIRTSTNEVNPMPGEWLDIDLGDRDDIRKLLFPNPYKDPSPTFIQLAELIRQDAQRFAGTVDFDVGQGSANIPVGTMLAMVEQATQMTAAIHKRTHSTQARELQILKDCFARNPEALWKLNPNPARQWQTAEEFESIDIIPSSDPNVPAQIHRIMIALAMVTMASQNPDIYDRFDAHTRAWNMIGVDDTSFLHQQQPQQQSGGDPGAATAQASLERAKIDAQVKMAKLQQDQQENQRKAASEAVDAQQRDREMQQQSSQHLTELASQERVEQARQQTERLRLAVEQERAHGALAQEAQQAHIQRHHEMTHKAVDHAHEMRMTAMDQAHEADQADADRAVKVEAAKRMAVKKPGNGAKK